MTPLFEMPQLLTLSGDPFSGVLNEEYPNFCTTGCGPGCQNGCDVGSGGNAGGGEINPDIKI